jgi:hypothetical protein
MDSTKAPDASLMRAEAFLEHVAQLNAATAAKFA